MSVYARVEYVACVCVVRVCVARVCVACVCARACVCVFERACVCHPAQTPAPARAQVDAERGRGPPPGPGGVFATGRIRQVSTAADTSSNRCAPALTRSPHYPCTPSTSLLPSSSPPAHILHTPRARATTRSTPNPARTSPYHRAPACTGKQRLDVFDSPNFAKVHSTQGLCCYAGCDEPKVPSHFRCLQCLNAKGKMGGYYHVTCFSTCHVTFATGKCPSALFEGSN